MTKAPRNPEDHPEDQPVTPPVTTPVDEATPDSGQEESPARAPARRAAAAEGAAQPPTPVPKKSERPAPYQVIGQHLREFGELIRELYLSFDRRTLGFTRLCLGFFLLGDLIRHAWAWKDMYSNEGVLPTHLNLYRPQAWGAFSIFNAFSTMAELRVLWAVMFVTFFCLFIGYKTKVAQILSLVFVASMNGRVLFIENGGYVVHNLLVMWTCFLPLGDRFSVDAMLASMKRRREASAEELNDRSDVLTPEQEAPFVTAIGAVLLIQLSAIYFFNVIHKTGPAWHNGTAVHYVLYVDRMVNPIVGVIRDYIPNWLIIVLTKMTLGFEAALPVALLQPLARAWSKRLAIVMINALHIGFGTFMVLGPFAWACCVFSTLLFSPDDWEIAGATMRREHRARTVLYDRRSPGALLVCRILKRLDHFELLSFEEAEDVPLGIAILAADGARKTRAAAFADIVAALPLGPTVAWIFRAPGLKGLFNAVFAWLEGRDLSGFFGLRPRPSLTLDGPSAVRLRGRRFVAVLRELGIAAMFAGAVNQAAVELWVINRRWKIPQPEPLRVLAHKLRFLQGWFMFSPNPVMDDGTIVVDALTVDGRHIDPFTLKPPGFDISQVKSYGYSQIWSDYFNRMHLPGNAAYRDAMRDYMLRLPERTGRPEDAIVSGEVFWVQDMNPKWNDIHSFKPEKVKLFAFENPSMKPPSSPTATDAPPATPPPAVRRPVPADPGATRSIDRTGLRRPVPTPTPAPTPAPE